MRFIMLDEPLNPTSQCEKVYNYISDHPGCTSRDIILNCNVINNTGRISEINERFNHPIECLSPHENGSKYYTYQIKKGFAPTYAELKRQNG